MALVYDTGGSDALIPDVWVAIVRSVVTPMDYRENINKRAMVTINGTQCHCIQGSQVNSFECFAVRSRYDKLELETFNLM